MEHCSQVQQLTVERDPVKGGDGRAPRVGTAGMVEESGVKSGGRASVRHSRAVSTPPVRSVHPMDPIGSGGRGWLMGPSQVGGVAVRWRGQAPRRVTKPAPGPESPGQHLSVADRRDPRSATGDSPTSGADAQLAPRLSAGAVSVALLRRSSGRGDAARDDYCCEADGGAALHDPRYSEHAKAGVGTGPRPKSSVLPTGPSETGMDQASTNPRRGAL